MAAGAAESRVVQTNANSAAAMWQSERDALFLTRLEGGFSVRGGGTGGVKGGMGRLMREPRLEPLQQELRIVHPCKSEIPLCPIDFQELNEWFSIEATKH